MNPDQTTVDDIGRRLGLRRLDDGSDRGYLPFTGTFEKYVEEIDRTMNVRS